MLDLQRYCDQLKMRKLKSFCGEKTCVSAIAELWNCLVAALWLDDSCSRRMKDELKIDSRDFIGCFSRARALRQNRHRQVAEPS